MTPKTLQTEQGPVRIAAPRDRQGTFEPPIVRKGQRRFEGFDDKIVAMYARGMTTRDIEAHLTEIYGVSVGRDTISRVTAAVLDDAQQWQTRPLEALYPIVYLDALVIKIRDERAVRKYACYLAIGVNAEGERDVLGMWFQRTEGAKFWLGVLTELKARGVCDVLVCCVDGLTGFPEAIEAVYPKTWVQTCLVHQVRSSLRFVSYRDRRAIAADLKKIYTAVDRDHAETELERFAETWDHRYPMISASWLEHWEHIVPFLAFPADVRRVIYTTNTIEGRGRDRRCRRPPARIPACASNALGSSLGSWRQSAWSARGAGSAGRAAIAERCGAWSAIAGVGCAGCGVAAPYTSAVRPAAGRPAALRCCRAPRSSGSARAGRWLASAPGRGSGDVGAAAVRS
jgi:putative transposase